MTDPPLIWTDLSIQVWLMLYTKHTEKQYIEWIQIKLGNCDRNSEKGSKKGNGKLTTFAKYILDSKEQKTEKTQNNFTLITVGMNWARCSLS